MSISNIFNILKQSLFLCSQLLECLTRIRTKNTFRITAGARIRLIRDGDVAAAIETARPNTGIDILMGIGGTPEGVVTAAAMRALGGVIQGRLHPRSEQEKINAEKAGLDLNKVLTTNDLVSSDDVFFSATGITDGELLKGVRYTEYGAISHSLVVRGRSKTVRIIETEHRL